MTARRILFVDHATAPGGAEHALLTLFAALDRTRFAPQLASPAGALADAASGLGIRVHHLPLPRLRAAPGAPWHLARAVAALMRIIRESGVELVHVNTVRASVYGGLAARLTRRRLVWHVHDILEPGVYVRGMCRAADVAVAVSAAVAAPLPCVGKVRVIHNGVRSETFRINRTPEAARLRAQWGIPPAAPLVGQVARLQPWKGQRDVIAVAEMLAGDVPDLHVAVVGGDIFGDAPAYERELRARVRDRGLTGRVVFAGHQDDVPAVLAALDVLVHASDREPFGRILIEAGAAGLPVVAYASGAVPEIIVHDKTGVLVPPGDRGALAAALRRVLADPALARRLGETARAEVAVRFDARRLTRELEHVFDAVLEPS